MSLIEQGRQLKSSGLTYERTYSHCVNGYTDWSRLYQSQCKRTLSMV